MAASALSFCAVGASASTRAALLARAPVSRISVAMFEVSTVLSGAAIGDIRFLGICPTMFAAVRRGRLPCDMPLANVMTAGRSRWAEDEAQRSGGGGDR